MLSWNVYIYVLCIQVWMPYFFCDFFSLIYIVSSMLEIQKSFIGFVEWFVYADKDINIFFKYCCIWEKKKVKKKTIGELFCHDIKKMCFD